MIYVILALIIVIMLLMVVYITHKFVKVVKESKLENNKKILWVVRIVVPLVITSLCIIDVVNTAVVLIHLVVFSLIIDFLLFIYKKITKREVREAIRLAATCCITLVYLIVGYYNAHNVVQTSYNIKTDKDIGRDRFRIVQISDSHIGATMSGNDFSDYMEMINNVNADLVVITGDFVDDDTSYSDMQEACDGIGKIKANYGIYFVYGNHDKGYFSNKKYTNDDLIRQLNKNGVVILEDEVVDITENISLVGRKDKSDKSRKEIFDVIKDIDKEKYIIVLDHQPTDYENEKETNVDLVLSGHTHGGQLVPLGWVAVKLGINDAVYGLKYRNNTAFVVSSGIGDWAIQFKTGTISEYVVINVIENR